MRFYLHAVANVFFICGWPKFSLHAVAIENGHRGIKTEIVTKMVPVIAVELSIGAFCTEFRREQLCDDDIFGIEVNFSTKRVAVRAQKLSTIAFCTEFRCESNGEVGFSPTPA